MDPPPLVIESSSFSTVNPSSYSLAEIWPFPINAGGLGLRMGNFDGGDLAETLGNRDGSAEVSTVTEQSGGGGGGRKMKDFISEDEASKIVSPTSIGNDFMQNKSSGKTINVSGRKRENMKLNPKVEISIAGGGKLAKPEDELDPYKDYIHVRARRGQATDSHSLAERARREKLSEKMKVLQDLIPGCNKVIGKAHVLDEIINYVQSLQRQVEFLSVKLETVNSRISINPVIESFHSKNFGAYTFDPTGMMSRERASLTVYAQESQQERLHMQVSWRSSKTNMTILNINSHLKTMILPPRF